MTPLQIVCAFGVSLVVGVLFVWFLRSLYSPDDEPLSGFRPPPILTSSYETALRREHDAIAREIIEREDRSFMLGPRRLAQSAYQSMLEAGTYTDAQIARAHQIAFDAPEETMDVIEAQQRRAVEGSSWATGSLNMPISIGGQISLVSNPWNNATLVTEPSQPTFEHVARKVSVTGALPEGRP